MSDNGWPGEPGVPLNPERDGWHWCERDGGLERRFWSSGRQLWAGSRNSWISPKMLLALFGYAGPCLTPTEVDARVSEAMKWRDAINAALTNWLAPIEDHETPADALQRLIRLEVLAALDPAVSRPAADLVAKARRDALEEAEIAAKKAGERHQEIARRIGFEPTIDGAIGHACADIRALKGEGDE